MPDHNQCRVISNRSWSKLKAENLLKEKSRVNVIQSQVPVDLYTTHGHGCHSTREVYHELRFEVSQAAISRRI